MCRICGGQFIFGGQFKGRLTLKEIKRLKKALDLEKMRSAGYSHMIELAEQQFNIPIRKKSGTKQ